MVMPRELARIFLRVTDLRMERLHDISERDILAEGVEDAARFVEFWDAFNAKRGYGWDTNPWVWVYTFEHLIWKRGVDFGYFQ